MTKAEEQALKAYPDYIGFDDVSKTLEHVRNAYVKGYKQAEQDLLEKVCKWIEDNFSLYEGISGYHVAKELKQSMKDE